MTLENQPIRHIRIAVDKARIPFFFVFFGYGVKMAAQTGRTLRDVLCRQFGMDADYVDHQVQTLFLNAKAVDDVDSVRVENGATIALSAAMPGLAGAVFRKGGVLSAMRSNPPPASGGPDGKESSGWVMLKLFNRVAADLGPALLARGIRVEGTDFKRFFETNRETLSVIVHRMEIDGDICNINNTRLDKLTDGEIELSVRAASEN